ncbi:MAG: hypothetical protein K9M36_01695 [Candidatus Pacebacteria bacterium]|nr:hypothetical protein [Candidatus Paceibacterota bacterium]
MNTIERPCFTVCENGSDHGHFIIPSIQGMSFPIYCKEHALLCLNGLIRNEIVDSAFKTAIMQDINTCNLPNTETPEVRRKAKKISDMISVILRAAHEKSSFDDRGICKN